jgi:PAS domain S-box-containing protein
VNNLPNTYRAALRDFLVTGGETALENAYALGRQALEQGAGLLDLTVAHHQALIAALTASEKPMSESQILEQAGKFLAECLSPFEMAQRGFRETIATLNALNDNLENEVEKRTQAVRLSEERYRTLIDVSPDAIMVTDLEGKVLFCNQLSALLHGYSDPRELLDKKVGGQDFIIPEELPRISEVAQEMLRNGTIGRFEYTMITRTGMRMPVEARSAILRDADGNPVGFIGINRDVSERKRIELRLASYANKQAALVELGRHALSDVDTHTLMQTAVELVAQTLEVEFCELLELIPEKNNLLLRAGVGWKEALIGNAVVGIGGTSQAGYTLLQAGPVIVENLPTESRFIPPNLLMEHNIIAGMTVIINNKERPYGVLGAHTSTPRQFTKEEVDFLQSLANILAMAFENRRLLQIESDARKRAEEARERAVRSMAIVSHELRTPLTSIKGFASTLLAEDVVWTPDQQHDFIQTIDEEANKLGGFIEQVLDLSRMDAGLFKFSLVRQSVEDLIGFSMNNLRTLAARHRLTISLPDKLPSVMADTQRVGQVLTNLVENAAKYAPAGTSITVSARRIDHFVELSIADEGPGIPSAERERIFQPFYRLDELGAANVKGAGLGLTICWRLVQGQGGRIWVHDHEGPGTIIHFTLPVADDVE